MARWWLATAALAAACAGCAPRHSGHGEPLPRYAVQSLGGAGGLREARSINDAGVVVGVSTGDRAAVWRDGRVHVLLARADEWAEATCINAQGDVVGRMQTNLENSPSHAFLVSGDQTLDLGTLGGTESHAYGVNDSRLVVGESGTKVEGGSQHAFLWQAGKMRDLGTLGGGASRAAAVNARGDVVGVSDTAGSSRRAFLWRGGHMVGLPTLGGDESEAADVSDSGQVVGWCGVERGHNRVHAALWHNGSVTDLSATGGPTSQARAINARGQVVGYVRTPSGQDHAFLWANGRMLDTNELLPPGSGWVLEEATSINNRGQIVGRGTYGGQTCPFLLTPIQASRSASQ